MYGYAYHRRAVRDTLQYVPYSTNNNLINNNNNNNKPTETDSIAARLLIEASNIDSFFSEHLPPSHAEEREHCFNTVLGMPKVQPLVDLVYDPVTTAWCEQSHRATVSVVMDALKLGATHGPRVQRAQRYRWFDLELASTRAVCIDRYHLSPSVAVPLWETDADKLNLALFEHERHDANRNIPALLLRRIYRAEIIYTNPNYFTLLDSRLIAPVPKTTTKTKTKITTPVGTEPRMLDEYLKYCLLHETPSIDAANFAPIDLAIIDLQWLLAPFTDTMAYLFDSHGDGTDFEPLARVLGDARASFETWHIPPPAKDPVLMELLCDKRDWRALRNDYQMFIAFLWRVVKAHTLRASVISLLRTADRTEVFNVAYGYMALKSIEMRCKIFIDTHLDMYGWALGDDGAWSDAEWFAGPGARPLVDNWRKGHPMPEVAATPTARREQEDAFNMSLPPCIDVGTHSPIALFYPHCRNEHPWEGSLPDVSTAIGFSNLTRDVNLKPSNPTLNQAAIHELCKQAFHRCLVRNFTRITLRYIHGRQPEPGKPVFYGFPSIKQWLMLVIRCGLLGNWRMATTRPNFAQCIAIEYAFLPLRVPSPKGDHFTTEEYEVRGDSEALNAGLSVGEHPTRLKFWRLNDPNQPDSLSRWIENNDMLCFYLLKEYYVYAFEGRRSLDIVMSRYGQWGRYKNLTTMRMDHVRYLIDREGGFDMAVAHDDWRNPLTITPERRKRHMQLMSALTVVFDKFYRSEKNCFIKLYKGFWPRVFVKQMNAAVALYQKGKLPSGYKRVGMPGDDDPDLYVANGHRLTSTMDLLTPEEIRVGEQLARAQAGPGARRRVEHSDDDDDDDDEDDDDEEDDEEEDEEDEDEEDDEDDDMDLEMFDYRFDMAGGGMPMAGDADQMMSRHGSGNATASNGGAQSTARGGFSKRSAGGGVGIGKGGGGGGGGGATAQAPIAPDSYANEYTIAQLAKQLRTAARQVTDVDFDLMDMTARDVMRRRQTSWFMESRWLAELFGIPIPLLKRFCATYSCYDNYDMPDHQLLERSYNILRRSPRDFYVIRLYMYMLLWHSQQQDMALPLETRHKQLVALRRRWEIPEQQDLPRDIGWRFFCPGSRRWFSSEAGASRHKIDTMRDRQRYQRDTEAETSRAAHLIRQTKVQLAMRQQEKETETLYSVNMEQTTYNNVTGQLYARRSTDPGLHRLQALVNQVQQPTAGANGALTADALGTTSIVAGGQFGGDRVRRGAFIEQLFDTELADMLAEIDDIVLPDLNSTSATKSAAIAAAATPHALLTGQHVGANGLLIGATTILLSAEAEDNVDDLPVGHVDEKRLEREVEQKHGQAERLLSNNDISIVSAVDAAGVRRQWGWLTDATRASYRSSTEAAYSLYDSGFRTPLVPMDVIGRVVLMNERPYCLCVDCGVLTTFESGKIAGNEGPNCGLHDPQALLKSNRRFLIANSQPMASRPSTSMRELVSMRAIRSEHRHQEPLFEAEAAASTCHFCTILSAMTGTLAQKLRQYTLVREESAERVQVHVCSRDESFAWGSLHSQRAGGYPSYERVLHSVTRGRMQTMLGTRGQALSNGRGGSDAYTLRNPNLKVVYTTAHF